MSNVAVVFWSSTGNTEAMADAVANGAKKAGASVTKFAATDFDAAKVAGFDGIAFGCPAMGAEVIEENEFEPMWNDVKGSLGGRKVVLFGSYGWGSGEWMESWAEDAKAAGVELAADPVIANEAPDDEAIEKCEAIGAAIA